MQYLNPTVMLWVLDEVSLRSWHGILHVIHLGAKNREKQKPFLCALLSQIAQDHRTVPVPDHLRVFIFYHHLHWDSRLDSYACCSLCWEGHFLYIKKMGSVFPQDVYQMYLPQRAFSFFSGHFFPYAVPLSHFYTHFPILFITFTSSSNVDFFISLLALRKSPCISVPLNKHQWTSKTNLSNSREHWGYW